MGPKSRDKRPYKRHLEETHREDAVKADVETMVTQMGAKEQLEPREARRGKQAFFPGGPRGMAALPLP